MSSLLVFGGAVRLTIALRSRVILTGQVIAPFGECVAKTNQSVVLFIRTSSVIELVSIYCPHTRECFVFPFSADFEAEKAPHDGHLSHVFSKTYVSRTLSKICRFDPSLPWISYAWYAVFLSSITLWRRKRFHLGLRTKALLVNNSKYNEIDSFS